jgi:hypothetical protein
MIDQISHVFTAVSMSMAMLSMGMFTRARAAVRESG